jgi:metal-sulfur cluster biosynthetic enzyme
MTEAQEQNKTGNDALSKDKETIIEVMKGVEDPELELDIWTLGLIYDIKIDGKVPKIKMTFTSPMCPYAPQLVEAIKRGVGEKGFSEPEFEFTFDPPWEPTEEVKALLGLA